MGDLTNQTNETNETTQAGETTQQAQADSNSNVSLEEQNKQLMIEFAKLKRAFDKTSSELASTKKSLKEKMSEAEVFSMEKAEKEAARDEELAHYKRLHQISELEKNFLKMGYSAEQANIAAIAQNDGDTDTLFKVQGQVQQELIAKKEAEWLKSRPQVSVGVGGEKPNMTKEEFEKASYMEQLRFKKNFPETFLEYIKN